VYGTDAWGWSGKAAEMMKKHHKNCVEFYNALLRAGICREQARGVLPQNLYTEYYGTVNLNNLFKFIDLRSHDGAQWEIQKVAEACLEIVEDIYPITVQAYRKWHGCYPVTIQEHQK
jgi:thymidylate synthase (FAD)